jgi:hypothetical protein
MVKERIPRSWNDVTNKIRFKLDHKSIETTLQKIPNTFLRDVKFHVSDTVRISSNQPVKLFFGL